MSPAEWLSLSFGLGGALAVVTRYVASAVQLFWDVGRHVAPASLGR